ncbi:hypothetical protein [Streptomyces sp. SAI-144]|uniref:hypothetical protein n=1 Tax=Streptomyces sp. SAI-144 TaxID=2940544 RepID=UPI00247358C6|nr:hypothetical protein [Streptomyces sp. SAI-144]
MGRVGSALDNAARALADDLRAQIDDLQTRLREAEMHLEHLVITRKTVTGLADRLPLSPPEHPDYPPRVIAAFNESTGPRRAKDVCQPSATNCCRRTSKAPAMPYRR